MFVLSGTRFSLTSWELKIVIPFAMWLTNISVVPSKLLLIIFVLLLCLMCNIVFQYLFLYSGQYLIQACLLHRSFLFGKPIINKYMKKQK